MIKLTEAEKVFYKKCLKECILTEDEMQSWTEKFEDGFEMDVKICGCQDEPAFTEAVLFKNGCEAACTDCFDELTGEWSIDYNGKTYTVVVA